jgi:hypothetical protein
VHSFAVVYKNVFWLLSLEMYLFSSVFQGNLNISGCILGLFSWKYIYFLACFRAVFLKRYKPMPRQKTEPKYEAVRGGAATPASILLATALTFIITAISHLF